MANEDVWVWTGHLGISRRIDMVLTHYGDRITDVSIFGWTVDSGGNLAVTFDPLQMNEYREKWPHIRWWGAFRNMDHPSETPQEIWAGLRGSAAARAQLASDVRDMFSEYPWLYGVDIDLESGGNGDQEESEEVFRAVADAAHGMGKRVSCALPPLTSTGSVGGENWVRYYQLGQIVDHVEIMTYDFAWMGSAPGPIAPGFWVRNVADWVASQIDPKKVSLGVPLYAYFWTIHDYPDNELGWRGESGTYYAAWQYFTGVRRGDDPYGEGGTHAFIGWIMYRDDDSQSLWGYTDVYDWLQPDMAVESEGVVFDVYEGNRYSTRYGLPATSPVGGVVDNRPRDAHATYSVEPRRVRDESGNLVEPQTGYGLTVSLLRRPPVAATIIDDYITSQPLYVTTGDWSYVQIEDYRQMRGSGTMNYDGIQLNDRAAYMQARGQFASDGTAAVHARGWEVEYRNTDGRLRLLRDGVVQGTSTVSGVASGAAPGAERFVIGLRVRENSARAYFSLTEEGGVGTVLAASGTPINGTGIGISTGSNEVWWDHFYMGDGWWYMPRERIDVKIGEETRTLGEVPRTGITWRDDRSQFRPNEDVDERETREDSISLDWGFEHWNPAPLTTDVATTVTIIPRDIDVWLGRIVACDANYARIIYVNDPQAVLHWRSVAAHDYGFAGIAMWSLGQEDVRLWDLLDGGLLPNDTKVLNV